MNISTIFQYIKILEGYILLLVFSNQMYLLPIDIIEGLKDPAQPEKSNLGINLIPFRTIKLGSNQETNRKKIRNFIKKDSGLSDTISSKTREYQKLLQY